MLREGTKVLVVGQKHTTPLNQQVQAIEPAQREGYLALTSAEWAARISPAKQRAITLI